MLSTFAATGQYAEAVRLTLEHLLKLGIDLKYTVHGQVSMGDLDGFVHNKLCRWSQGR